MCFNVLQTMSAILKEMEGTPYMKSPPAEDPKQPITTKAPRSLPVAFAMLEKIEMSDNPRSLSAHTVFGDGAFF